MAVTLNGERYLSDPFTVDYTAAPTPTATVSDVTIDGTTGTAIADKEVIITLANDTFAPTLSGSWITNLPAGCSHRLKRLNRTAPVHGYPPDRHRQLRNADRNDPPLPQIIGRRRRTKHFTLHRIV